MTDEKASVPPPYGPAQGQPQPGYPIDQGGPYPPQSPYGEPTTQQTGYGGGPYPPQAYAGPTAQQTGYDSGGYPPQSQYGGPTAQQTGYDGSPYPPQASYGGPTMQQSGYGGGAYPPPVAPQPGPTQMQSSNVVVITQPQTVQTTRVHQPMSITDSNNGFVLALVVTILAVVCGCWWALACSIPAMVISLHVQDAARKGDYESVRKSRNISLGLSVAAIVSSVVGFILLVAIIVYA